jgi:hypothetical protein
MLELCLNKNDKLYKLYYMDWIRNVGVRTHPISSS